MSVLDGNSQKTPLAQSLQRVADARAKDADFGQGKTLPCKVVAVLGPGIVTVSFEVATAPFTMPHITMPVMKPPYVQYPIQEGDRGLAIPADVLIGHISGLGTGIPSIQDKAGNLGALSFVWLGNKSEAWIDQNALVLYQNVVCTPTQLAFFGGSKVAKQTVSGPLSAVTDGNAKSVLTSLITALANYGLIENGIS